MGVKHILVPLAPLLQRFNTMASTTCAKCIRILETCTAKVKCDDCLTCPKCISIRKNCKTKTTCNKCKEAAKIEKEKMKHAAEVAALKEAVKRDPTALLKSGDCWSEEAIRTAADIDPTIAERVLQIYPTKRCYAVHTAEKRAAIIAFLEEEKNAFHAILRTKFIDNLYNKANQVRPRMLWKYMAPIYCCESPTYMEYDDWLAVVQKHPGILEFVPSYYRTYSLCLAAMRSNVDAAVVLYHTNGENFPLRYVPDEHLTEEMCLAPAAWCNRALWFWPYRFRTLSMYVRAAAMNPSVVDTTMPEPFNKHPSVLAAIGRGAAIEDYFPKEKDIEESLDCSICMEEYTLGQEGVCKLSCKHILHRVCINKWLQQKNNCPMCRTLI